MSFRSLMYVDLCMWVCVCIHIDVFSYPCTVCPAFSFIIEMYSGNTYAWAYSLWEISYCNQRKLLNITDIHISKVYDEAFTAKKRRLLSGLNSCLVRSPAWLRETRGTASGLGAGGLCMRVVRVWGVEKIVFRADHMRLCSKLIDHFELLNLSIRI